MTSSRKRGISLLLGVMVGGAALLGGMGAASAAEAPASQITITAENNDDLGGITWDDGSTVTNNDAPSGGQSDAPSESAEPSEESGDGFKIPERDPKKDSGVGDIVKKHGVVDTEKMGEGAQWAQIISGPVGWAIGVLVVVITLGLVWTTATDILYIILPGIRPYMHTPGTNGAGTQMAGVGMQMHGQAGDSGNSGSILRIVFSASDDAVNAVAINGGEAQAQGQQMGGFGGGGFGGGFGAGMSAQANQRQSRKSVILAYFSSRILTIVLTAICLVVLLSSQLMGFSINIGEWLLQILDGIHFPWSD